MAILLLHTEPESEYYEYEVDLEGSTYAVELRWNSRAERWFLSLFDHARMPLATGRKVVVGAPLLGRPRLPGLPPGTLLAVDTSGREADPGRSDLGTRVLLAYVEEGEAEA